jgi:hypothetical protein
VRDIPAGEELTIDYRLMDDVYDNLQRDVAVPPTATGKVARKRRTAR